MGDSNSANLFTLLSQILVNNRKLSATPTCQGNCYLEPLTKVLEAIAQPHAHTLKVTLFEVIK
jgi:hypothetical protein